MTQHTGPDRDPITTGRTPGADQSMAHAYRQAYPRGEQCPAEHHDGHRCGRGAGHLGPHDAGQDADSAREVMARASRVALDLLHTDLPLGGIHISAIDAAAMARGQSVHEVVRVQLDTVDQVVTYAHAWSTGVTGKRHRRGQDRRGDVATITVRDGVPVRAWCPASAGELDALGVPDLDAEEVGQ